MEWIIENWIEVLGYGSSVIVLISLMISSILMLVWSNAYSGKHLTTNPLIA
jgi:hypothetical protein